MFSKLFKDKDKDKKEAAAKDDKKKEKEKDKKKDKKEKKTKMSDLPGDMKDRWAHYRVMDKTVLSDIEEKQMTRLHAIYKREVFNVIPEALEILDEQKDFKLWRIPVKKARRRPTDLDFEPKTWLSKLEQFDGVFIIQATQICKDVCKYQKYKKEKTVGEGCYSDPENLFCEEIKMWALDTLSKIADDEGAEKMIEARVRYLEEVLCEDELFDRPLTGRSLTIQIVIVAVRRALKYSCIPIIEKSLGNTDARRALDSLKKHLMMLISDSCELLWDLFRKEAGKGKVDTATRLLTQLLNSPEILKALPDTQEEIREKVMGKSSTGKVSSKDFLTMAPEDKVLLSEDFFVSSGDKSKMVEMDDAKLEKVFVGEESGIDDRFRSNAFIAFHYLKAHALLMEIGGLYGVIEMAAKCASQGGTLLVYGQANAQLNAMLETCDDLLGAIRDTFNILIQIADIRFEELIFLNEATVARSKWFAHFKNVPALHARVAKKLVSISHEIGNIKAQANSMSLFDRFQQANEDTNSFCNLADKFAKRTSNLLGLPYETPDPPPTLKLPDISSGIQETVEVSAKLSITF